jgi:hypothetical protein
MVCTLCAQPIDLSLAYPDPWSFSVDHTVAIAEGGDPYEPKNLEPAHLIHNIQKSTRSHWSAIDASAWIADEDP